MMQWIKKNLPVCLYVVFCIACFGLGTLVASDPVPPPPDDPLPAVTATATYTHEAENGTTTIEAPADKLGDLILAVEMAKESAE